MKPKKFNHYRGFKIVRVRPCQWVVRDWKGMSLREFDSYEHATKYVDRILKGDSATDASLYGCPI